MSAVRLKATLFLCALSAISLFIWLISNSITALTVFSFGLLIYLASHIYWLDQLHTWFKNPSLKSIPEGSSAWEDIFTALLQYERSNQLNQTQLNSALERFSLATNAMPDGELKYASQ